MFISEIIETFQEGDSEVEICATADTHYDPSAEKVYVALDGFARRVGGPDGEHLPPYWLPPAERVSEHLSRNEAAAFAKDVFQSWVKKVRTAVPSALRSKL